PPSRSLTSELWSTWLILAFMPALLSCSTMSCASALLSLSVVVSSVTSKEPPFAAFTLSTISWAFFKLYFGNPLFLRYPGDLLSIVCEASVLRPWLRIWLIVFLSIAYANAKRASGLLNGGFCALIR